jgi:hypothetical protein
VYNSGCNYKTNISKAWEDAVKMAGNVGTINFNDFAAVDFFGPPYLNSEF